MPADCSVQRVVPIFFGDSTVAGSVLLAEAGKSCGASVGEPAVVEGTVATLAARSDFPLRLGSILSVAGDRTAVLHTASSVILEVAVLVDRLAQSLRLNSEL